MGRAMSPGSQTPVWEPRPRNSVSRTARETEFRKRRVPKPEFGNEKLRDGQENLRGRASVFSRFFIDRPIFASVLSIVITLAGGLSLFTLPLAQFPRITPPTITVQASYPGASAKD